MTDFVLSKIFDAPPVFSSFTPIKKGKTNDDSDSDTPLARACKYLRQGFSLPLFYWTISPKRMSQDLFQKELLFNLQDYRCAECAGFDFEASQFIPIRLRRNSNPIPNWNIPLKDCSFITLRRNFS
jgi:hypothetical protein